jgi:hypothetical protein
MQYLSGQKGVTSFNLLQVGVTWGISPKAFKSCIFEGNWGVLTCANLKSHYEKFIRKLKEKPFRPFDALIVLLGTEQAVTVSLAQCITVCHTGNQKRVAEGELSEEWPRIIRRT